MVKKMAWMVFSICAVSSGLTRADDQQVQEQAMSASPQALSDAELDAITAGGAIVVIANPGHASVQKLLPSGEPLCINCAGPSQPINGIIITPGGKTIVVPGGPKQLP